MLMGFKVAASMCGHFGPVLEGLFFKGSILGTSGAVMTLMDGADLLKFKGDIGVGLVSGWVGATFLILASS